MRSRLSLQKRILLSFLGMSFLVVIASAAGFFYSISVQNVGKNSLRSLEQIRSLNEAQRNWQAASASLDRLFVTRQLEVTVPSLENEVAAFEAQIINFQHEQSLSDPQLRGYTEAVLSELSGLSSEMGNTVAEIIRLTSENRWIIAGDVREKVLAPQQTKFNEQLIQLNQAIQSGMQMEL